MEGERKDDRLKKRKKMHVRRKKNREGMEVKEWKGKENINSCCFTY
jgi:hypothetical protein